MLIALAVLTLASPQRLVFDDEFDVPGQPDPQKWNYECGFVRNQEPQWYQPENARVEDGLLIIEARRERVRNPNYIPPGGATPSGKPITWKESREYADFTSTSLTTKGKQYFLFGHFEMRARFDSSLGMWPAFWSTGQYGTWPSKGEIDIFEYYQHTVLANAAWGTGGGTWDTAKISLQHFTDKDNLWAKKFHIWTLDWSATKMIFRLDGELTNEVDLTKTRNPDGLNPFHQPHGIILNLAVGATGGSTESTRFPARFEIDYVRIYQP